MSPFIGPGRGGFGMGKKPPLGPGDTANHSSEKYSGLRSDIFRDVFFGKIFLAI